MKKPLLLKKYGLAAACIAGMCLCANAEKTEKSEKLSSNDYFAQARILESKGDADGAMAAYKEALRLNPRNANAEHRMLRLKKNFAKVAAEGRQNRFSAVMIPEYKIQNATLNEALLALSKLVEQESNSSVSPNFIVQDTEGKLDDTELTLVLKNIPAGGILKYVLEQSKAKARFDEHAIAILPL